MPTKQHARPRSSQALAAVPAVQTSGNEPVQHGPLDLLEAPGWLERLTNTLGDALGPLPEALQGWWLPERSPDPALNDALDALAAQSPAFAHALDGVDRADFHLGPAGAGSANLPGEGIQIDPDLLANPEALSRILAHELGHAVQPPSRQVFHAGMTRQEYVDANTQRHLEGEAEALMMEFAVREDLLSHGVELGVTGSTAPDKLALYEAYRAGEIDRDALIAGASRLIGTEQPSRTAPGVSNYVEHYGRTYGDAWDAHQP